MTDAKGHKISDLADSKLNRDIEVLRAFAVVGVVMHHLVGVLLASTPGSQISLGPFNLAVGVDLFFVISGFVIGRSILPRLQEAHDARTSRREVLAFWVKRVFRLWPTAWFWLAMILVVTATLGVTGGHLQFSTNVDAAIAGVLNFANFRFAESFEAYPYGASFHYWTLSLEEQFYFLLPIVALFSRNRVVFACALVALIVLDQMRPLSLINVATRVSALVLGVLIALWSLGTMHRLISSAVSRSSRYLLLPFFLATLMLLGWISGAISPIAPHYYLYVAAAAGSCVLVASFNMDVFGVFGPLASVFRWLGSRSYAIYVIHVPVFVLFNHIAITSLSPDQLAQPTILLMMASGTVTLILMLAELNFRLIETPLRKIGVRLAARITRARQSGGREAATAL
ncbi:MAG: acyltransferase [Hyphomonadaceae bacterium]|nr:acyltransferase [Hyphomonadaceae bacterium]